MFEDIAIALGISAGLFTVLICISLIEAVLKGISLWYSAQQKKIIWFICILIFNTAGILPLIYLIINKPWRKRNKK